MSMLETNRNETLRRRFGWIAEQACRTLDDKDDAPTPRKKQEQERAAIRKYDDTWYVMTMWMLASCHSHHYTMN